MSGMRSLRTACWFLVALAARGDAVPAKLPAWQWSLQDRLEARLSREGIQARAAAQEALARYMAQKTGEAPPPVETGGRIVDTIDGEKNPELFLPWELFNYLANRISSPDAAESEAYRHSLLEVAVALGFGADFWERFEMAASPYLKRVRATQEIPGKRAPEDKGQPLCLARKEALQEVYKALGESAFLRILYEGVAPTVSMTYEITDDTGRHLRFVDGGCR